MADEIQKGPMGWGDGDIPTDHKLDIEKRAYDRHLAESPMVFQAREARNISPIILDKWQKFQESKGFGKGSNALWLMTEFVFGKAFAFYQQDIGSCVYSNTFREVVDAQCGQIAISGKAEEYFGTDELGMRSIAPHCVLYGIARQKANMRSGDGLYASPMAWAMSEVGFLFCNNPKLKELAESAGASKLDDFPEPRSTSLYRKIGNWAWNDTLRPYCQSKVAEMPKPRSVEELMAYFAQFKTGFMCSSIAIKKKGTHKDGFAIHTRDLRDRWDHNMGLAGNVTGSDGNEFVCISNRSWTQRGKNPYDYVYNVAATEVDGWCKQGLVDWYVIGEIDGPDSMPPTV